MNARKAMIRLLDRPGLRWALGLAATQMARANGATKARVYYDGAWIRTDGAGTFIVDGPVFEYWTEAMTDFERVYNEEWDRVEMSWLYRYNPKPGDVVIDVGAGNGIDSLLFARRVGPRGRVIAVEANPTTYSYLTKAIELNNTPQIVPLQVALVAVEGPIEIEDDPFVQDENRLRVDGVTGKTVTVPGVRLDDIAPELKLERVDFLKMNIEGAERLAIEGMRGVLKKTRYVCISCHDFRAELSKDEWFRTKAFISDKLKELGFDVVHRDEHPNPATRDQVHGVRS